MYVREVDNPSPRCDECPRARAALRAQAAAGKPGAGARQPVAATAQLWQAHLPLQPGRGQPPALVAGGKRAGQATAPVHPQGARTPSPPVGRCLPAATPAARRAFRVALAEAPAKEGLTILRRLLTYAEKVLALSRGVAEIHDGRRRPRIPTAVVVRSLLAMWLARLGSLNALEQTRPSPFWRRFLGAPLPSADTLGRVPERIAADSLREVLHQTYTRLKRNKALPATSHGLTALVLDGHETHTSYHRHCPGCCVRLVGSEGQQRPQFYHRVVSAMLLSGDLRLWLDAEPQGPGEDAIAAGGRLIERVLDRYPRAFDVVLGDALYTDPRLYAVALGHGKDVLSVLKNEDRDLVKDARALFATLPPQALSDDCRAWDVSGLESWAQGGRA